MSKRRDSLLPPEKTHTEDPGAHDLESDDEHFSDAQSAPAESPPHSSPIPTTRVEKVSDEPSYGEVPGTEAYRLREGDALPDEITILPQTDNDQDGHNGAGPASQHGLVPTTVLEETPDDVGKKAADGKKHQEDPAPDLVVRADGTVEVGAGTTDEPISQQAVASPISTRSQRRSSSSGARELPAPTGAAADAASDAVDDNDGEADDDDFGDDFDDFEEGGEGDADDDDFGDFDDSFQEPSAAAAEMAETPATATASASATTPSQSQPQSQPPPPPSLPFPVPDFTDLDQEEVVRAAAPYLNGIYFPDDGSSASPLPALSNSIFLTPRSASLWSQLVAPPPLQPPDWIRSRIRRLFLVSLGVPVDLDEILPASKQKKLVLPSLSIRRDSPRTSTDSRGGAASGNGGGGGVARLKQPGTNTSNTSVDSQGRPAGAGAGATAGGSSRKRKGPPPVPDLDLVAAQQLCETTDEALDGMTDGELRLHLEKLQALEGTAKAVLDFWTKRTDEKIGDREAFEGVIENLVAHARKTRK